MSAGLQRPLEVVSKLFEWSGILIKLDKSVITAFDYRVRRELDTKEILYNGKATDESFPCLGVRAVWSRAGSAARFRPAWRHVFSAAKEPPVSVS